MLTLRKRMTAVCVALAVGFAASNSCATNESHATAGEALMLPRFCWSQYMQNMQGPEYQILGCGPGMNHYCDGLVELGRAHKPTAKRNERIDHLMVARHDTQYTIRWMQDYPSCPIRSQVETTLHEIELQLRLYGVK